MEDNAYTTDGTCLLDGKPCNRVPCGDCINCGWWKEYLLGTTGSEE